MLLVKVADKRNGFCLLGASSIYKGGSWLLGAFHVHKVAYIKYAFRKVNSGSSWNFTLKAVEVLGTPWNSAHTIIYSLNECELVFSGERKLNFHHFFRDVWPTPPGEMKRETFFYFQTFFFLLYCTGRNTWLNTHTD